MPAPQDPAQLQAWIRRVFGGAAKMSPVDSRIWRSSGGGRCGRLDLDVGWVSVSSLDLDAWLDLDLGWLSSFLERRGRFCGGRSLRGEVDGDGLGWRLLGWWIVPDMVTFD